jgi:outer membrane usher protein
MIRSLCFVCVMASAWPAEPLILNVVLNEVPKGDIDARLEQDIYWLNVSELKAMGLKTVEGSERFFSGQRYIRADQINQVSAKLDTDQLQILLQADPALLPVQSSDFSTHRSVLPWQGGSSAYLNYGISAFRDAGGQQGFGFTPTINASVQGWNLRSRHDYQSGGQGWLRLDSSLTYDSPDQMTRLTLGDLSPVTGALGRGVTMAGIGLSRVFSMQPEFETKPGLSGGAPVTSPSTAEIYVNGVVVKNMNLQPGMYQFQDLSYFSGFQDISVVIRDQYGNRQVYNMPYYFDDSLLKAGLHEFNYNLGLERNDGFDDYQGLAFSGLHRFGVTDSLTMGLRMERTQERQSAGALLNMRLGDYGVLGGAASWADNVGEQGYAALMNYRYENQNFNLRGMVQKQSTHYLSSSIMLPVPGLSASLGFGFGHAAVGNWGVDVSRQTGGSAAAETAWRLSYSASPARNVSVSTSLSLRDSGTTGFVNLAWMFDNAMSAGSSFQRDELNQQRFNTYLSKTAARGEGWGYRLNAEHSAQGMLADGFVQGRFARSQLTATARQYESGVASRVNVEGALAYIDGHWGLTRPIDQSFALVQSQNLSGVGLRQNGQLIGRTSEDGYLWVPDLGSYGQQQLELAQNDIPIEYDVLQLRMDVMPGQNMGKLLVFKAERLRAWEAKLLNEAGQLLADTPFVLKSAVGSYPFVTSLSGAVYLEHLSPGRYQLVAESVPCSVEVLIPERDEVVIDLGSLVCKGV